MTHDAPFAPIFSRESFLVTLGVGEALRRLEDGLGAREPFLLVTGEPGTGKTALVSEAVARWGDRVRAAHLVLPVNDGGELIEEILRRLDVRPPEGANRPALVACLEDACAEIAGRGQVAVIVVDDAHHLTTDLLEELRLLANAAQQARRPLEVLLAGLPALESTLDDPALAALRQRISARARLEPLTAGETRRYIRHRLAAAGDDRPNLFPRKTCAEIAAQSRGVPRHVNLVAAGAMGLAREAGHPTVEPGHVREAVAALTGVLPKGELTDTADSEAEDASAAARARAPEKRSAPPPAPVAPAASRAAREEASRPAPTPAAAVPAGELPAKAAGTSAAGADAAEHPAAAIPAADFEPPANSDPSEWVARFIGEKGPIRISSQAMGSTSEEPDRFVADDETVPESAEAPPARPVRAAAAPPSSRPRHGADLRVVTTVSLAAVAAIAVLWWGVRAIGNGRSAVATSAVVGAPADTVPSGDRETSARAPGPAPAIARATPPDRAETREATAAAPLPKGPYTLDTGVRGDHWAALDERDRVQALTGIEGWVAPAPGADDGKYRVVLGIFSRHSRAESAANMLMRSRTLANVKVVPLPPRSARQ